MSGDPRALARPAFADLLDACVHCGFCLPVCPTYRLWGEEMDSPRGRIYMMKGVVEGDPITPKVADHFDRCLGCMACVTACPSGVQYDKLIQETRAEVESRTRRSFFLAVFRRVVFWLFPHRERLRLLVGPLRLFQSRLLSRLVRTRAVQDRMPLAIRTMASLVPPIDRQTVPLPSLVTAVGERRGHVGMLTGCVQSVFFPSVNWATARVLAAEGFDVVIPDSQPCCGALSSHAGRLEEARSFARSMIRSFDDAKVSSIVVNSAGCGSAMKEYGHLLEQDPLFAKDAARFGASVFDFAEFVDQHPCRAEYHPVNIRAAYHDACHLAHAQGITAAPRRVLARVPGLEVVEVPEGNFCCGSAGVYNLFQPGPAAALGERKARNLLSTEARILIAANPGCSMQIASACARLGQRLAVAHTAEILDMSIRNLASSTSAVPS